MFSFLMKKWIRDEFDKFTGGDENTEQDGTSGEELVKEENRRAAEEAERKARQEKIEKEREVARQKIRDKHYNTKKKDDPLPANKKHEQDKVDDLTARINNANAKVENMLKEPKGTSEKMNNDENSTIF